MIAFARVVKSATVMVGNFTSSRIAGAAHLLQNSRHLKQN
jgi:hypothetical protein